MQPLTSQDGEYVRVIVTTTIDLALEEENPCRVGGGYKRLPYGVSIHGMVIVWLCYMPPHGYDDGKCISCTSVFRQPLRKTAH